jgi:hypothetical protein
MQLLPTRLPINVLQRVEEVFPAVREIILTAIYLCADKRILSSYSQCFMAQNKMLASMFLISVVLKVLCTFCSIIFIILSMLVVIGHIRGIRYMYYFSVPISEDCLKVSIR